jgi:hypothetical protein
MSALRSITTAVLVVSTGSCSSAPPTAAPPVVPSETERVAGAPAQKPDPVVLVTIDGARWQDVFDGAALMPTLHALGREQGAFVGADAGRAMRATGPNFVSLPGYTEIFTGRASSMCRDNDCPHTSTLTLLDRAADRGLSVAAFASWEKLDRAITARPGRFVVSTGRDAGDDSPPWPGSGSYRGDAKTAELALDYLELVQPDLLFIGLGDPDEHAHHGNVGGYRAALAHADAVLARLVRVLDRMGDRGKATHVFVTADHGRANDFRSHGGHAPESARVWLVGAGPRIRARGHSRSPRERHLADIAPTIATLIGVDNMRAAGGGEVLAELFDPPAPSR